MRREIGVDLSVVTRVAVNVAAALRSNCTQLDSNGMTSVMEVLQGVSVASDATELLATTVNETTGQAEPQIRREVALGALLRDCLLAVILVLTHVLRQRRVAPAEV